MVDTISKTNPLGAHILHFYHTRQKKHKCCPSDSDSIDLSTLKTTPLS